MAEIHHHRPTPTDVSSSYLPEKGYSTSQILAVVTLVPIGGVFLTLAGLILTGTVISLAVSAPLFVIFSPILVPAALATSFVVTGILTSGALGVMALASITWLMNYARRMWGSFPEQLEHMGRRVQDTAGYMGQKTREVGPKEHDVTIH
ncbi:Oleosin 18.2 kDa-like [Castilleja foliolosa]|uniref:Oleosin 18.2 kDa-like n=1 Tax=Castilleja foliolosa TaxID=1961234 RepID=A0ABD3CG76_9LAMI